MINPIPLGHQVFASQRRPKIPVELLIQLQYRLPNGCPLAPSRRTSSRTMDQSLVPILPIPSPYALRLPITQPQPLRGLYQRYLPITYPRQHFHPSPFLSPSFFFF